MLELCRKLTASRSLQSNLITEYNAVCRVVRQLPNGGRS